MRMLSTSTAGNRGRLCSSGVFVHRRAVAALLPTLMTAAALRMMSELPSPSDAFTFSHHRATPRRRRLAPLRQWDDFAYDDDDELLLEPGIDSEFVAADENDDPSVKAAAGAALEPPSVDWHGPVIDVPQGMQMWLCIAFCCICHIP